MAANVELKAKVRERAGKGAARATRREGRVPAVIYGDKKDPELISLEYVDVLKAVGTGQFLSHICTLDVEGKGKTTVLPRDVQFDPVRDFPVHIDFMRVAKGAKIVVEVPVHFLNEASCVGLKRGGALNIVRHEIEIHCPVDAIPEFVEIDIADLDIGHSKHASALILPKGVELTITDRDFTVVTVAGHAQDSAPKTEES
jgi:large subunit ribosomal protein L25